MAKLVGRLTSWLHENLMGILLPVCIAFVLYSPLLLKPGVPFYGDETYYAASQKSYYFNFGRILFPIGNIRFALLASDIPIELLVSLLGRENGVKCFVLLICSLSGIFTYFAIKTFVNTFFKIKPPLSKFIAIFGSLFYMLAFSNGITACGSAWTWPYITFPLSYALFCKFIKEGDVKSLIVFGLISALGNAQPMWVHIMSIPVLLYIALELVKGNCKVLLIKRSILAIFVVALFNAFWIVPLLKGWISGGSGVFQTYTTEKLITFGGLQFLSKWNTIDVMMVGERSYFYFWLHPQNYGPLNVIIPLISSCILLIYRRNRYAILLAMILVAGIFLAKGVNEPGGYLYYLIAKSLPYGIGAILRNPGKFAPLVNFSYAILTGLFIAFMYEKLSSRIMNYNKLRILRPVMVIGICLLLLSPITYGTVLGFQGYTWPRYEPTYIPSIYDDINDWLSNQPSDFKVMWIPSGGAYVWKPYIITAFPDLYSSRPAVSFTQVYPKMLESTDEVGKLLKALGVKYVVYHGDSLDYPNEEILQDLLRQKDLKVVYEPNYTYVPEDNSGSPREITVPFVVFENEEYSGPVYIQSLASTSLEGEVNDSLQEPKAEMVSLLNYKQISPVEWEVTVNASSPFILVFTEPYDRLWKAYVNGKEVEPITLYSMVNGFPINETGISRIKIYYTLQTYYNIGLFISGISFMILIFLCIYRRPNAKAKTIVLKSRGVSDKNKATKTTTTKASPHWSRFNG